MRHFIDAIMEPALWFAADWSLRWAALIAVAALLLWIFRPRRAAIRQLVLLVALIAGLLVPLAPRWGDGWEPAPQRPEPSSPPPSFPRSAWERTPGRSAARPTLEPNATQSVADVRSHAERGNEKELPSEPLGQRRLVIVVVISCWIVAVAYQLMRCLCGWIFLRSLRRGSVTVTGATADLFTTCRAQLRVGSGVQLAIHPHVCSPILLGWLRPLVLVPSEWPQRSIETQRAGLLHELAHVRRRDHLLVPLLETVRIAFFFHPLVRWLLARLEHERELLCDEMVVRMGIDRRDYAHLLVELARSSGRLAWPAVSLPMSRRRTVKGRIHHLLEEDMERWIRPLPTRWAVVLGGGLLVLCLGLASYRAWAVEKAQEKAEKLAVQDKVVTPIKREDLRYAGKDFYQWRRELLTELKPAIRADGMKAFAAFAVNGYSSEATQAILELMRGYDPFIERSGEEESPVVQAAYFAILKIGRGAVQALAAAINEKNRNVRVFAFEALGRLGDKAQIALPALLRAFKNDDLETRQLAITAVGRIGSGHKEAAAALIEELNDKNEVIRAEAVQSLGWLGESARPAVPALMKALSDKDSNMRSNAIFALERIGADATAVAAISRLLQDKEKFVRDHAVQFLGQLGKPDLAKEAVPDLIAALKNPELQFVATTLLKGIGPAAKDAVPELTKLLRSNNPNVRKLAMEALDKIGPNDER